MSEHSGHDPEAARRQDDKSRATAEVDSLHGEKSEEHRCGISGKLLQWQ